MHAGSKWIDKTHRGSTGTPPARPRALLQGSAGWRATNSKLSHAIVADRPRCLGRGSAILRKAKCTVSNRASQAGVGEGSGRAVGPGHLAVVG